MKSAPKRLWLVLALLCFAGLLKATLPQIVIGNWTATNSLSQARSNASAVMLSDGRILFIGGDGGSGAVQSAEFFGTDGTVSPVAAMNVARSRHFAVALSDGGVLVGGGNTTGGGTTNSAEIYDPSANTWTATSPMTSARANATAAVLPDGRVVIAGGDNSGAPSNTIEIYDPASGSFSFAGTLSSPRTQHAMAVLQDSRILIVGGTDGTNPLASSDIFDPSSGNVSAGPALTTARYAASATTLLNGQVAVIGGAGSDGNGGTADLASIEVFDPASGAFTTSSASLAIAREGHQAFLLPNNNNVLIVGGTTTVNSGTSSTDQAVAVSELFTAQASSSSGAWSYAVSATGAMNTARAGASGSANQLNGPTSTVAPKPGLVIVGGGTDATSATLASTEVYGYPTVQTDQADYPPGTAVNVTGSGFNPGETVTLTYVESPLIDTHGPYTVVADGNGNISDSSFVTDDHDLNVRFWLSAAGSQSGLVAQNTLTDSKPNTVTVGPQQQNPASPGGSTNYSVTVNFNGNGNSCTSPLSIQGALPTGVAASFNPTSLTSTGGNAVSTLTLSTSSTTPPGSANFTVLAGNGTGCQAGTATGSGTLVVVENTTTSLTSSQNPSVFGQSTTLKATVAQTAGTTTPTGGTVTFLDGTTTIGTATLSNGTATLNTSALTTGAHSLTASYAGVANTFGASASSAITQTVNQASTTTTVVSSANPSNFGQSVTFTATVVAAGPGSGTPTGTVTFSDNGTSIGTGTLNGSGLATFTTSTLAVGSHPITAAFGADTNFKTSTSSTLTQTVNQATSATTVASSANPSVFGQSVTFTATVTATGGTPTGTVTFKDGASTLGTGILSTTGGVTTATFSTSTLSVGAHSITAVYGGDTNFSGSTSTTLTQTVNKGTTSTALTSSANPSVFGQSVTFTATVTVTAPGSGTVTDGETVTFKDGGTTIGTGTTISGVATFATSTLTVATHSITAAYPGDTNFTTSTSSAVSQVVNKASTTTTIANDLSTATVVGQSYSVSVSVAITAPGAGTIPNTDTVTVSDGSATCTVTLTSQAGSCNLTSLTAGAKTITATYNGDTNFNTSTSGGVAHTVNKANTATTITSNTPNPSTVGQLVTINYAVAVVAPGAGTPTGNVTVSDGSDSCTGTVAAGSCTITFNTAGSFTLVATYAGDSNFLGTASAGTSQTANPKLAFTSTAFAIVEGICSSPITVQTENNNGSGANQNPARTLNLSSTSGTGKFFSDATCITSPVTTATIASGASSATFFYSDSTAGSPTITAASTGLTSVQQAENIDSLRFQNASFGVALNQCSATALIVQSVNPNPTALTQATTINLSSSSAGGKFYGDAACITQITTTPIAPTIDGGHDTNGFFYKDTNPGAPTLTASAGTASATQVETVAAPPSITKAFGAATIPVNGTTTLTFTITNPTANTVALNGLAFTDTFPAGLSVASTPNVTNSCGGTVTAGTGSVSLSGGTVGVNASCTIGVNVTGTTSGVKNNTTGAISSTNGGTGNTASASITVATPPTISKAFGASSILLNASTSLTFTINNPNSTSLSGVAFSDTLPAGLVVSISNALSSTCSGTPSAIAGSSSISLSGGTVAASSSCSISVNVTGTATGTKLNTTSVITSTESGPGATSNTATLNVTGTPPTITSGNSATFTAGVANSFTVTTSGTPTPSLSETGPLPSTVTFTDNGNGTATIAGTATTAGSYPITITAQNGITPNATQIFTLTVVAGTPNSISVFSGSGQSTTVNMAFGNPLVALVADAFANPVSGASVTFAAPASGASGNFGGNPSFTTTTDATGKASAAFTANTVAGGYSVTASTTGVTTPASFTLQNLPGPITTLVLTPSPVTITAGDSQNYTALGVDAFTNPVADVTAATTFSISPDGSCIQASGMNPASCTTNVADVNGSSHTVLGTYSGTGAKGMASLTVNAGSFTKLQILVPGETAAPGTATGKTGTPNIEYVNGPFNVTVNAVDQFFNVVSSVTDTVDITSNDTKAKLPSDAALVSGTGTFSVTLESVSYNPSTTTITASDVTDNLKTSDTSPAIEVIVVYTATITPTTAGTGDATPYTLTVNNSAAPNTNNLASLQIAVPSADQGSIASASVAASNGGPPLNWSHDASKLPGTLRFFANSDTDAVTPGGTITITFTATSNAVVNTTPVSEEWTTVAFSDAASNNALPLAPPEPTVQIGAAPKITSANTTTFTFGTPGTFTVTSTGSPTLTLSESGALPGGVTFTDNGGGLGTIAGTPAAAGNFPITITAHNGFGPDATQNFTLVVNKADSVTTVVSNAEPSVFGQSVTFNATVSAVAPASGTPTGTVQFMDGASPIGSPQTLNASGNASVSTSSLSVASHSITAVYGGDNNFNKTNGDAGSTAIVLTQDVNKADTSSPVASSVNPSVFGQSVTFTATVTAVAPGSGTPTGSVTFKDGATTLGTGVLSGGSASVTTSALSVGTHTITAYYGGDTNFNVSTGTLAGGQTVNKADTTTALTSSVNPSVFGQLVTFTATVSAKAPGSGTPTGTVTFMDGTTAVGTGTLSGGIATVTTSALAVGNHPITAAYSGDTNFTYSTGTLSGGQTVYKADTTTTLTSSVNPSVFGQSVTFTAAVSAVAPGSGTASGTVTFMDGTTTLGTGTLSSGMATLSTSSLGVGPHPITASYGGDPSFNGSTSNTVSQTVNKADTITTISSITPEPSVVGQTVTVSFSVAAKAPGSGTPTGNVTVSDGTASCTATAALGSCTITFTTAGAKSLTATYAGDGNFNGSTSAPAPHTVNKADTATSVTAAPNPSTFGQSVTFTATVSVVSPGAGTPTGTVTFMEGTTSLGTGTLSGNVATFSTSALNAGTHPITANYGGDSNFNTSTGTLTGGETVNRANTSTAVTSSLNASTFGQSVRFIATVTNASFTGVTPTGSVQFVVDGSNFGAPVALNASGVATSASISTLTVNGSPHSVTANYTNSDGNFNNSNGSLSGGQIVNKATTATGVTSSVNPSVFGQGVTFTATVTNASGTGVTPTGSVQFVVDGLNFGGPVALNAAGMATSNSISTLSVSGSPHSVTASYVNADGNFVNSTGSLAGGQTVNKASTSVSVTSSGSPSVLNAPVTLTANISVVAPGAGTPTGTVTFTYLNGALSGTLGTATLNASGVATLTTSALPVNVNAVKATYSGDGNFSGSNGSMNQTVQYLAGGMCAGDVGHSIRQPINPDQSSVFKLGSTVPTKFAVCDVNGNSIGTAGIVTGYGLVAMANATAVSVDETVYSTTPDTAFRWDPTGMQWIFNQSTKNNGSLNKSGVVYFFVINLNDGTSISFAYALK